MRLCVCVCVSVVTKGDNLGDSVSRIRSKTKRVHSCVRNLTTKTEELHPIDVAGNMTKHFFDYIAKYL